MGKPVLSVENLSSSYDDQVVVNDVSFEVQEGEIFGLVGLNGAGKTTLLKTILELKQASGGTAQVEKGRQLAYLPERFEPPWFLKGADFIRFSLKFYNKTISDDDLVAGANSVSLNNRYLKQYVHSYSKGMRQKLGLLATVLTGCPLLVLDEPMSGLDPKARQEVKAVFKKVKAEKRSILLSSHILADVAELCDRVAVFHNNQIVFLGSPHELAEKGGDQNPEKAFLSVISA